VAIAESAATDDDVIRFLIDGGILEAEEIVGSGVTLQEGVRRNRNTRVEFSDGSGVFVKRPEPMSPLSQDTLIAEGEFYLAHGTERSPLAGVLARLRHFDRSVPVIVLELLSHHRSLREICLTSGVIDFPISAYRSAARALADVHGLAPASMSNRIASVVRPVEWIAGLRRPEPRILTSISNAGLGVLEIVQASASIDRGIAGLEEMWRPEALVHGDVRADNLLVDLRPDGEPDVRIIDWELWQVGDPAWDVAGLLEAAVTLVIGSPALADTGPDVLTGTANGISVIQVTCRGIWNSYATARGLSPADRQDMTPRVVTYCAARIIQSVAELTARADAIPGAALVLLQVAENIFAEPERATAEFFALPR